MSHVALHHRDIHRLVPGLPSWLLLRKAHRPAAGIDVMLRTSITFFKEFWMKILYINNDGGGFADRIEIEPETTVQTLFDERVSGRPSDYLIRVNRQPAASDYRLQEGDRVSFTPVKIEGAVV
jgi:hypothetical protein